MAWTYPQTPDYMKPTKNLLVSLNQWVNQIIVTVAETNFHLNRDIPVQKLAPGYNNTFMHEARAISNFSFNLKDVWVYRVCMYVCRREGERRGVEEGVEEMGFWGFGG
jgi:hypothetical protein